MSLSTETVNLSFELLLGRKPENQLTIDHHARHVDIAALGNEIMNSLEFKARAYQKGFAASKWVSTEVLDRYTMWIDLHDRYVSYGCLNNNWEPEETEFFRSRLRTGDVVLDIGANIGWFSLVAAKEIGLKGQVHAFEPRPETAKRLKQTVAQNDLRNNIHVWEYALSDSSDMLQLKWGENTENPGGSHLSGKATTNFNSATSAPVIACCLDDLLPNVAPDIIKIDVEGAEPRVMAGSKLALKRKRPVILSELFPQQLQSVSNTTCAAFIMQMEDIGYGCYELQNGQPGRRLKDFPSESKRDLTSVVFEWRALL